MNWDQIKGNWQQVKSKVKEKWGKLTDDEIVAVSGQQDHLTGLLQRKYGLRRDRAELEIKEFARDLQD